MRAPSRSGAARLIHRTARFLSGSALAALLATALAAAVARAQEPAGWHATNESEASCLMQTSLQTAAGALQRHHMPESPTPQIVASRDTSLHYYEAWPPEPMPVWIYTFGRSGSTLLEKLVFSMVPDPSERFCVFEPCHHGDKASFTSCTEEMQAIMTCDYQHVDNLHWWGYEEEGMRCGSGKYDRDVAQAACSKARFRVFKTIHMHNLALEALPLLKTVPHLKVINLMRDPRRIFMSAIGMGMVSSAVKSASAEYDGLGILSPVWHLYTGGDSGPLYIRYMCRMMLEQAAIRDPEVLHVRYEDLTSDWLNHSGRVYKFLGTPKSRRLRATAAEIIEGDASGPSNSVSSFAWTCKEMEAFESEHCAAALMSWGYDPHHPWQTGAGGRPACQGWTRAVMHDAGVKVKRLVA
eukprot:CAMPEP_0115451982 /NCGR_PEP_ID=MMETSP0271-20121206/42358_1 /TAXON_ID=71861 /ORGANISM="Scrippsiella trochoidea, Strain CCMP3099" /LENGTH=409 /DNA_ID=CAMNT_0002878293 /DNA_START=20 /DNA_END=1246 /DNA_ORIENTATION=+